MTTLSNEEIKALCDALDTTSEDVQSIAIAQLSGLGPAVIPHLAAAYGRLRKWQGRLACVFHVIKYARTHDEAFQLGLIALEDRATLVRYRACMLLAQAQRPEAIEHLRRHLDHKDKKTAEDAAAAIDAIENKNPNFFVDRSHSGRIVWSVATPQETLDELQQLSQKRSKPWWKFW